MTTQTHKAHSAKTKLRTRLKDQVCAISSRDRQDQSKAIAVNLQKLLKSAQGVWGGFMPLVQEPEIFPTVCDQTVHIEWAFPRVDQQGLHFFANREFSEGKFKIQEPAAKNPKARHEIRGFVIPGLGFSPDGHRLGWGAGYYDRYLNNFNGPTIGVCFDFQMLPDTEWAEAHDFQVDHVVTPTAVYHCEERSWK